MSTHISEDLQIHYRQILIMAIFQGILTFDEYISEYQDKYINDNIPTDSFFSYLETIMLNGEHFLTSNKAMIGDAEKLEKKVV